MRSILLLAIALCVAACGGGTTMASNAASLPPRASGTLNPSDIGRGTQWQELTEAPTQLSEVAVAAHDDQIWVAGGLTADGKASAAVQVYDPATNSWSEGPSLPAGTHHSALVSAEDALWLIGGYRSDGFDRPSDEVLSLLPDGDEWLADEPLPEAGRPERRRGMASRSSTRAAWVPPGSPATSS